MSLIRQIWLLLLATLVLAFVGSVGVTINSARDTLQTQLSLKNNDSATSLALVLSQQQGVPELMELLMAAQFDTGYYQAIRFTAADGQVGFNRELNRAPVHAPAWFVALLPIESAPGVAQVSSGWKALGSVQVVSQSAFAHDDLWEGSLRAAAALALLAVVSGLLAKLVMDRIRQPLDKTVAQAHSLVEGEFVIVEEPRVPELKGLTRAMNGMVARLKLIFEAQASQVESLRQQAHADPVTGLANRRHFMGQLSAARQREDGAPDGGLVLVRLLNLAEVNRELGRAATDQMIQALSKVLRDQAEGKAGSLLGRLNGSDFALALAAGQVALQTARAVAEAMRQVLPAFGDQVAVAIGAVEMQAERPVAALMGAADNALARAESRGPFAVELADWDERGSGPAPVLGEAAWRQHLLEALAGERVRLVRFPLLDAAGQMIHLECPLRLQLSDGGPFETAARWLPFALRGHLTGAIDERAVARALADMASDGLARCINISTASLLDSGFAARLRSLLTVMPVQARQLSLEVPELAAVDHFDLVQEFSRQLRPMGVCLGIEHAGERLGKIDRLFEAGLDYVKLDAALVDSAVDTPASASFLKGVVVMLHGLSLKVYAEGVSKQAEAEAAWAAGVDGVTGPWASAQRKDLVEF